MISLFHAELSSLANDFNTINTVSFINSNRGWVGGYGELQNTTTRGEEWINGPESFYNQDIKKMVYADSSIAYMNVSNVLKKTIDAIKRKKTPQRR